MSVDSGDSGDSDRSCVLIWARQRWGCGLPRDSTVKNSHKPSNCASKRKTKREREIRCDREKQCFYIEKEKD